MPQNRARAVRGERYRGPTFRRSWTLLGGNAHLIRKRKGRPKPPPDYQQPHPVDQMKNRATTSMAKTPTAIHK